MTLNPERNDIDLSKLFHWSDSFIISDKTGKKELLKVWIRLVGDAELNRARVFALRKSAELRKRLHNLDSDERLAFVPEIEFANKESLIESLLIFKVRNHAVDATNEVKTKLPKEPKSEATLEEQEKYQEEIDKFPKKRESELRKYIESKTKKDRESLSEKSFEELYKEYERELINQLCENEMIIKFREMCAYFGSYKDENLQEKLFLTFEEFENLPKEIKDQFITFYTSLEVNSEDLKNSPEAML